MKLALDNLTDVVNLIELVQSEVHFNRERLFATINQRKAVQPCDQRRQHRHSC